ncbi:DUF1508 domain-containing protein [Apibacter sp. B2912]|uniref:YegP family protein n=1 Tax=Apibacter sp. B2912 TaxID=2656763 RepID=UPI00136A68B4|nr:DUF1508 domain-containing protein [Apibacter sp. B2912]MXO31814.1 DUF1508 domain-containing protein [Apibacter sp. B2912]
MKHSTNNEKFFFEIDKTKDNLFYFQFKDEEGNIYLESDLYVLKTNCQKGIKSVIRNSKNDARVIADYPFYKKWNVFMKTENGKTRAFKTSFNTYEEANNFIEDLKSLTLKTPVVDYTKLKLKS